MTGMQRKPRKLRDAMRLLIELGIINRDGHVRGECRILYSQRLMAIELENIGWRWIPEKGWLKPDGE